MKKILLLSIVLWQTTVFAQTITENYPVDSASIEQAGVPNPVRGEAPEPWEAERCSANR